MNPSEKTRGAALTVLVADDDQTLRMLMRELLEGHLGAEVAEVASGTEAWNKLDAGLTPDLCIFDLRMPGIAGLSLLTRLRRDPRFKDLPVMICSTINSRSTIVEAAGLHVDAFLLKPFKADEFLERVRALCRKPRTDLPPRWNRPRRCSNAWASRPPSICGSSPCSAMKSSRSSALAQPPSPPTRTSSCSA